MTNRALFLDRIQVSSIDEPMNCLPTRLRFGIWHEDELMEGVCRSGVDRWTHALNAEVPLARLTAQVAVVQTFEKGDCVFDRLPFAAAVERQSGACRQLGIDLRRHAENAPLLLDSERRILLGFAESMTAIADGLMGALEADDPVGIAKYWRWGRYAAGPIALAATTGLTQAVTGQLLDAPSIHQQAEAVASSPPVIDGDDLVEFHRQNIERAMTEVGIDPLRLDHFLYSDDDLPGIPLRIDLRFTIGSADFVPDFEQLGLVLFDRGYRLVGYSGLNTSFSLKLEIMEVS